MKRTGQGKMRDIVAGVTKDIYGRDLVDRMRKGSLRKVSELGANESTVISGLSYLIIPYKDFNGNVQIGEMVVKKGDCAKSTLLVFKELFDINYPIERMTLVDDYDSPELFKVENDWKSIQANNTSAFNYRPGNNGIVDTRRKILA